MKTRGFSLIEVLISASLLALIGGLLLQSLSSSIDAKDAVDSTSNRYHLVRSAMSRMIDEISMAYLSNHRSSLEIRAQTGFKGEHDSLNFTAFGYVPRVEDSKQSDQRELGYFLATDPKTLTQSLMRREQPNPDLKFDEGGRVQTLLPNVREVEFAFFDPQKNEWAEKWDAAGTELNRLPSRVRIKFKVVLEDGTEQTFVSQSKLWLLSPLNF
jgi:type II secretion system protein J